MWAESIIQINPMLEDIRIFAISIKTESDVFKLCWLSVIMKGSGFPDYLEHLLRHSLIVFRYRELY